MNRNNIEWHLSNTDTLVLKGIAIMGMLCWHLFYCPNPVGEEFSAITKWFGMMGDVCVSAFLFASGYGLTTQFSKADHANMGGQGVKFIIRRYVKFYSNFWVILLIMLPIGIIGFNRPIMESDSVFEICKAWFREIFAIAGHSSYNTSWWFNALIIELYFLFPLLFYSLKNALIPTLLFTFLQRHLSIAHIGMDMQIYLPIFVIGMALSMYSENLTRFCRCLPNWLIYVIASIGIILPSVLLPIIDDGMIFYKGIKLYWLLTISLSMMIVILRNHCKRINTSIAFLGKHSSNIYWMHKLIFFYWFPSFFYSFHHPPCIFFILLIICLILSVTIEWLKYTCGYTSLVNKLLKRSES